MSNKITALLIFFLSLWSFAVLSPQVPGNPEVITRMALTLAIVNSHSLEIAPFAGLTVDKAKVGDRFYADKTPGHSLLAVPVVALAELVGRFSGDSTNELDPGVFTGYLRWATFGVNCLISALAVALTFLVATGLGASRAGAVFAAFALGLATPFLGWTTAFFAHSVAGSFLLFGFAMVLNLFPRAPAAVQLRPWPTLLLGLLLGYALVIDLTTAPAIATLGIFALLRARRSPALWQIVCLLGLGGVVGLSPLLICNELAFGTPFHLGYANTDFAGMQQGFFGITWPSLPVLAQLLFGLYRGLLPLSPIVILVPFGLGAMGRDPQSRGPAIVIGLVIAAYFWINASYYYWDGGSSTGPRHLVAMLPLAAIALAFAWPTRQPYKSAVIVLLAPSLAISLACAAVGMYSPAKFKNPLFELILPHLADPGVVPAAALVLPVWIAFAVLLLRADRISPAAAQPEVLRPTPAAGA